MTKTKPHSQGAKTVEQRRRTLERKPDMPRDGEAEDYRKARNVDPDARHSEFPVSRRGMNQESHHNKRRVEDRR